MGIIRITQGSRKAEDFIQIPYGWAGQSSTKDLIRILFGGMRFADFIAPDAINEAAKDAKKVVQEQDKVIITQKDGTTTEYLISEHGLDSLWERVQYCEIDFTPDQFEEFLAMALNLYSTYLEKGDPRKLLEDRNNIDIIDKKIRDRFLKEIYNSNPEGKGIITYDQINFIKPFEFKFYSGVLQDQNYIRIIHTHETGIPDIQITSDGIEYAKTITLDDEEIDTSTSTLSEPL